MKVLTPHFSSKMGDLAHCEMVAFQSFKSDLIQKPVIGKKFNWLQAEKISWEGGETRPPGNTLSVYLASF